MLINKIKHLIAIPYRDSHLEKNKLCKIAGIIYSIDFIAIHFRRLQATIS